MTQEQLDALPMERVENYERGTVTERTTRMIEKHSRHWPEGYCIEVHPEGGIVIGPLRENHFLADAGEI